MFDIIKNIYEDTNKSGGWSYISNHFNEHTAKDRTHYLQNNLLDVNELDTLCFDICIFFCAGTMSQIPNTTFFPIISNTFFIHYIQITMI